MKYLNKEFIKFVVSGLINTGLTYIVYLILLKYMDYTFAYSISYISGILISYLLNSLFVFKERISFKKFLKFPLIYIVQYLINLSMVFIFVDQLKLSAQIVPIIVILITIPITYLLSKIIIKGKK